MKILADTGSLFPLFSFLYSRRFLYSNTTVSEIFSDFDSDSIG
jgi:hypothetical protein